MTDLPRSVSTMADQITPEMLEAGRDAGRLVSWTRCDPEYMCKQLSKIYYAMRELDPSSHIGEDWCGETSLIRELASALIGLEPYLDAIVCYASTCDEHEPNRLAVNARAALARLRDSAAFMRNIGITPPFEPERERATEKAGENQAMIPNGVTPEMREAGAKQIVWCGEAWAEMHPSRWDGIPEYARDHYGDQAAAAYEAMRELDPEVAHLREQVNSMAYRTSLIGRLEADNAEMRKALHAIQDCRLCTTATAHRMREIAGRALQEMTND